MNIGEFKPYWRFELSASKPPIIDKWAFKLIISIEI